MAPVAALLNDSTDLFALDTRDFDAPDHSFEWPADDDAPPALAVVPRRSLRQWLSGTDLILEAIQQLDAEALTEERRMELSEDLVSGIAGTRAKVDSTNAVLSMLEGREAAASAEIERLQARVSRFARQRVRLTDYVLATMDASGLPQLDGETSTLKRQANPPKVEIMDVTAIPAEFLRHKAPPAPEPDKAAIARALKARREVNGARLVASARLVRT